jgi:hypothetical protein
MDRNELHDDRRHPGGTSCRFVGAAEFLKLLVSRRSLQRRDNVAASLCGLFDSRTGEEFVIKQTTLLSQRAFTN